MSDPTTSPSQAAEAATSPEAHAETDSRIYLRTWLWLLGLTLLELAVVAVPLPHGLRVGLLILLAVMKGAWIMASFMHLRFERLSFVYAVLSPLILAIVLLAGIYPDAFTRLP